MKTKLIVFTAMLTVISFASQAQKKNTPNKITFGVRAGVNFQNATWEYLGGDKADTKIKTGFHVGANAEIPIAPEFYIQPGVIFSAKGTQLDDIDYKVNIYYIEVPINFLYKPELGNGKLLLGVGPYIALGIAGNTKNGHDVDIEWKNEITVSEYVVDFYLKRLDAGGNLLVGYEFNNRFSAQLNAQLGLVNIHPKVTGASSDDGKFKNTGFGVSVGYRF